jgi:hypothetical protein
MIDKSLVVVGSTYIGPGGLKKKVTNMESNVFGTIVTFEIVEYGNHVLPNISIGTIRVRPLNQFANWAVGIEP